MASRTVTGLFESYDGAARAVRDLEATDIPEGDLSLEQRAKHYREEGWTMFDARAKPYSAEELARLRNIYRENLPL